MADIKVFDNVLCLVTALSDELQTLSEGKRTVHIALSGGSTPMRWFEFLAATAFRESIHWPHLHFWWGDERCVSPQSDESNYGVAKRLLFEKVDLAAGNIHRIRGEEDPAQERIRLSNELLDRLPLVNGLPQFDWVILGVGEDGHTASLFPNEYKLEASDAVVVAHHPQSSQVRLSLSASVIGNARRVTYLAMGASKSAIVRQVLGAPDSPESEGLPAARICSLEGETQWWLDAESAGQLKGGVR